MMEILIRNAEGNLTPEEREYAAKRLGRLDRYFNEASKVEIVHREEKKGHRVEVTVFADGMTVRGEEVTEHVRTAIDLVGEKIEGRLRRLHKRIVDRQRARGTNAKIPAGFVEIPEEEAADPKVVIKERKQFLIKPMNYEEAALEMEMLSHPFFVFRNEHTNQVEVLYKRKDGHYGVLQPEG